MNDEKVIERYNRRVRGWPHPTPWEGLTEDQREYWRNLVKTDEEWRLRHDSDLRRRSGD